MSLALAKLVRNESKKHCLICYGAVTDGAVCIECGDILLAMATVGDKQIKLTAQLLLSAARVRHERLL